MTGVLAVNGVAVGVDPRVALDAHVMYLGSTHLPLPVCRSASTLATHLDDQSSSSSSSGGRTDAVCRALCIKVQAAFLKLDQS